MKKIIISALFAVLATASFAMATSTWTNYPANAVPSGGTAGPVQAGDIGAAGLGSTTFSVSTNVTLIGNGSTGGYNCGAKHLAGDTGYVSASNNAGLMEVSIPKATAIVIGDLTVASGATFTQ